MVDMIHVNYTCDLCGGKCNNEIFKLPIAATFFAMKPSDLIPVEMNLCQKCRVEIYKVITTRASKGRIEELNKLALDIKMGRHDE